MKIRMTTPTLMVLDEFVNDPHVGHYGLELAEKTGLATGTVYPILARLVRAELAWCEWDGQHSAHHAGPMRKLYRLTRDGEAQARQALAVWGRRRRRDPAG